MKIGDYVRTKTIGIEKILDIGENLGITQYLIDKNGFYTIDSSIVKSSPNIIDLIEVGDYVNGEKITRVTPEDICGDEILDYQHIFVGDKEIYEEDIKSIVTKEQFESMEYRIGE